MNDTERDIRKALLRKFYRSGIYDISSRGKWGKAHLREDSLKKGFKGHEKGLVMDIAEDFRKMEILIKKPSSHGDQWYANIKKLEEIERIINDC
jgi:hypothetical protein